MGRTSYRYPQLLANALLIALLGGCAAKSTLAPGERPTSRPVDGVGQGFFEPRVQAFVVPPEGWRLGEPKSSERHDHLVWMSPTERTAYGVIHARIPAYVPVALLPTRYLHNKVLERIIEEFERDQGEARLLRKRWDSRQNKLYFTAEGGLYTIHSAVAVRGRSAWAVYAGRLREQEEDPDEMEVSARAREETLVGRDVLSD